jgi:hypothetical protein
MDGCGDQKGKKVGRFFDFSATGTEKAKVEALIFELPNPVRVFIPSIFLVTRAFPPRAIPIRPQPKLQLRLALPPRPEVAWSKSAAKISAVMKVTRRTG